MIYNSLHQSPKAVMAGLVSTGYPHDRIISTLAPRQSPSKVHVSGMHSVRTGAVSSGCQVFNAWTTPVYDHVNILDGRDSRVAWRRPTGI